MVMTALIMGFAGSLHCVGMCSPLALAVTNMTPSVLLNRFLYNAGRILTYGILGLVFSVLGSILPIAKFQNLISIALGVLLLVVSIAGIPNIKIPGVTSTLQKVNAFLKLRYAQFLSRRNGASVMSLGMLNGLLPCGLTFLGFTYCLTLQRSLDGFVFMILFGIGTLPAMLGLTSVIYLLIRRSGIRMTKVTSGLMIVSGVMLIARVFLMATLESHQTGDPVIDIVLCR